MKKMLITMTAALWMSSAIAVNSVDRDAARHHFGNRQEVQGIPAKKHRAPSAEMITDRMKVDLDLSKKQTAKVLELNKEYRDVLGKPGKPFGHRGKGPRGVDGRKYGPKKQQADGQTGATQVEKPKMDKRPELTPEEREKRHEAMERHMKRKTEYDAKLKDILSKKQFEKYQEMNRHHRHLGKGDFRKGDCEKD